MIKLTRVAPEVPAADFGQAIDYYERCLGFAVALVLPGYAVAERDAVAIHLFESTGSAHGRVAMHIFTESLDTLFQELLAKGAAVTQPIVKQPWGARDFRVNDPYGNELKFTEPLPEQV